MPTSALLGPPIESDEEDAAQEFEPQDEGENDHEIHESSDEGKYRQYCCKIDGNQHFSICICSHITTLQTETDDGDDDLAPPAKKQKTEEDDTD